MKVKKTLLCLLLCAFAFAALFAFTACSDKDPEDSNVASVAISPSTATLTVGEELDYSNFEITVTYEGDKEPEKIQLTAAMISEEDKQLLSEVGEHDITVSCKGKTTTLKVTVNPMEMNVTVSDASTIYTGEEVYPVVTGAPSGAKISYTIYQGESAVEANKVESAVDAGVYFVEVQVTAKNYTTVEETATINIAKAPFDTNELIWSNTGYLYTGEEVALAATVTGLPEGIELSGFTAEGTDQKSSASEKGYYTATANFTGENKNYVLVSCVINWRILESGSVALEPWFGAEDGELIVATFDSDTFTFGDTQTSYTVSYDENNGNATVTAEGYTSVTATDGVLRVEKAGKTYVLISESALARYEGEHSIYVEEFELVFDKAEGTATLVSKRLGEEAVTRNVTLSVQNGASADTAAFSVTGTDWVFTYNLSAGYLKLDGYKNPAAFDVISTDFYLPAKADVDAIFENITAGRFTEYTNSDLFEVTKENGNIAFTYNGVSVDPFCIISYSSYYGASLKTYVVPDSSCASSYYYWKEITVYDSYYKVGSYLFIPEVYAEFFGYYYLQDGEGLHVSSATKISFMEYSGYFRIIFNNANYDFDKGTLLLSAEGDTLTATLKKEGEADVTLTFTDGVSVSYDGASYLKIQTLLNTKGSYSGDSYYNGAGDELRYEVSSTSMKLTVGGVVASDFTLEKTANGKKITVVNEGKTFVIEWGDDVRYLTVNGELYVYGDMTSDSDGRTPSLSYVSGENTVQFTARQYILNETPLTNLTYALVDDGNGNGRTVLQATGYIEDTKYVILHYSQAAWIVNGSVYVPEYMENLFGSEYKQSSDSTETFRFDTDGKVKFRDQEIFPVMGNSLSAVKTFYYSENGRLYRFSLAIYSTRIQIYNAPGYSDYYCYLSSYFDFKGAYISQDGTKAFYFDAGTVYYDETSNDIFSIMPTDTGALMTIGSSKLEAVFTKAANGSVTLVYDGVTYVPAEVDLSSLYGTYIAYDGSESGTSVVIKTNPGYSDYKISKFIIFNGEVTPVFNGNYGTNIYFIKNNDGATSAKLPYLAVVDKYAKLVSTETFNGKELSISVGVTTKPDSTELMPALVVTYNNESVALEKVDYQNYKAVLGGVEYYLRANDNAETKDLLPLLVFEGWWETYDGEYSLNGNTVVLEIAVGGSDGAPETVLNVTFNGAAINASFESVSGGYLMHFTYENVEYIGVLNTANVLDVTVYTQKEYDFFFAAGYSNTVGGKDLVLPVEFGYAYDNYYLGRVITFNLEEAKYGEEEITFAQYIAAQGVIVFGTATQSYAYDIVNEALYTDVLPEGSAFYGISIKGESGSSLEDVKLWVNFNSFDSDTKKAVLGFWYVDDNYRTRGTETNLATAERVDASLYKLTGKNYNGDEIVTYLVKQEDNSFIWYVESEYLFDGEFTVEGKTLVIERTVAEGKATYTAAYNGSDPVSIKPDFKGNSFSLNIGNDWYIVRFTVSEGSLSFTIEGIPASAMAFVKGTSYAYNTYFPSYTIQLDITFVGVEGNSITYNVVATGSSSGTSTGTLSADGTYILAKVGYSNYRIYLNPVKDDYVDYVLVYDSCSAAKMAGAFTVDGKALTIAYAAYSIEDDGFGGFDKTKSTEIIVTYDGTTCTATTKYSDYLSSVEFTIGGTTYIAKIVNNAMTVTVKE